MKQQRRPKDEEKDQIQFEQDLYRAMRLEGLLLPETEEEVRVAEAEQFSEVPPLELRDALTALRRVRGPKRRSATIEPSNSSEVAENLARAAREGGKIPPEVEKAMEGDREAAERKKYGNNG